MRGAFSRSLLRHLRVRLAPAGGVHQIAEVVRYSWNRCSPRHGVQFRNLSACTHRLASTATRPAAEIRTIKAADQNGLFLDVTWSDGQSVARYPFIFLRDNCPCSRCVHPTSQQRTFDFVAADIDVDVKPAAIQISSEGHFVTVTWPDGHVSSYDSVWFNDHQLRKGEHHLSNVYLKMPRQKPWTAAEFQVNLQKLTFNSHEALTEMQKTYEWLYNFKKHGVVMLTDCGTEEGIVEKIADRVGFLRRTVFGRTFAVEQKPSEPNSHQDEISSLFQYAQERPLLYILHVLKGDYKLGLVDGFAVAERLRRESPDMFEVLSTCVLHWSRSGHSQPNDVEYHLHGSHPVLTVNTDGVVEKVNYGNSGRDRRLSLSPERAHKFYQAYKRFAQLCTSKDLCTQLTIQPGQAVAFDVWRLLFAPTFPDQAAASSQVQGAYIDNDCFTGCIRELHRQLQPIMED